MSAPAPRRTNHPGRYCRCQNRPVAPFRGRHAACASHRRTPDQLVAGYLSGNRRSLRRTFDTRPRCRELGGAAQSLIAAGRSHRHCRRRAHGAADRRAWHTGRMDPRHRQLVQRRGNPSNRGCRQSVASAMGFGRQICRRLFGQSGPRPPLCNRRPTMPPRSPTSYNDGRRLLRRLRKWAREPALIGTVAAR